MFPLRSLRTLATGRSGREADLQPFGVTTPGFTAENAEKDKIQGKSRTCPGFPQRPLRALVNVSERAVNINCLLAPQRLDLPQRTRRARRKA